MVKLINESYADIGKDALKENSDVKSLFFNIEKVAEITKRLDIVLYVFGFVRKQINLIQGEVNQNMHEIKKVDNIVK